MPPPAMIMSYEVLGCFAAENVGDADSTVIMVKSNKQRKRFDTFKV